MKDAIKQPMKQPLKQKSKWFIYPFFLVHMLMFGGSGFRMAYSDEGPPLLFMFAHGGIAIFVYVTFYLNIFGRDEVQMMFTNAALGLLGIYAQIGWILQWYGKDIGDYPWYRHITPFLYYVLYTFLLWQMVVDLTRSRDNAQRKRRVEYGYVLVSLLVYGGLWWLER